MDMGLPRAAGPGTAPRPGQFCRVAECSGQRSRDLEGGGVLHGRQSRDHCRCWSSWRGCLRLVPRSAWGTGRTVLSLAGNPLPSPTRARPAASTNP